LTGKYQHGQPGPEGARLSANTSQSQRILSDANFATLAKLEGFAEAHDHSIAELAMAWVGSQPFVGSVIAGATAPEQVEANVRALDWRLTPDDLKELDEPVGGAPS